MALLHEMTRNHGVSNNLRLIMPHIILLVLCVMLGMLIGSSCGYDNDQYKTYRQRVENIEFEYKYPVRYEFYIADIDYQVPGQLITRNIFGYPKWNQPNFTYLGVFATYFKDSAKMETPEEAINKSLTQQNVFGAFKYYERYQKNYTNIVASIVVADCLPPRDGELTNYIMRLSFFRLDSVLYRVLLKTPSSKPDFDKSVFEEVLKSFRIIHE
jgi:hypothetical protein